MEEVRIFDTYFYRFYLILLIRHWLFGEKCSEEEAALKVKGWFPRKCAEDVCEFDKFNEEKKKIN